MNLSLNELKYLTFPGADPSPEWRSAYEEAYGLWHSVWGATFRELDGTDRVFSDDFTRQHRIGAIMRGDSCIGVVLLRVVDFSIRVARHDSYFKVWSDHAISQLIRDGGRVGVGSHITVHPDYRGELGDGIRLKSLLLGLCLRESLDLGADVMTGNLRCNRGMKRSGDEFLATPIEHCIHHGVGVDLVAFYRRTIQSSQVFLRNFALESLWRRRMEFGSGNDRTVKEAAG